MNTLGRIGRMGEAWGRGFRARLKTVGHYRKDESLGGFDVGIPNHHKIIYTLFINK